MSFGERQVKGECAEGWGSAKYDFTGDVVGSLL